ncbi:unnamed protein product [Taenia asiatica]|uniref:Transcription initiation factor IIE subunit beta n=1 Tax=Taenia asiatica TaxID=60517 RepID=A0A0R3VU17_TAEAS|nr:unnamed protein product [Taenia asiatica]
MDPSLLKEREEFLRRAKNMPVVEKLRPQPQTASQMNAGQLPSKKPLVSSTREYLTMDIRSQNQGKFALLSRIVKYMRRRHLERDLHPLSVEEILEELQLYETPRSDIMWLENEALPNNPKIACTADKKFKFKPRYDIRSRNDLYQLLKRHEIRGLGGIYLDDICEAIPDAEKVIQSLGDTVVQVTTPHDKKTVLFFNDKSFDLNVEDEFKQLWRAVSVEGVHEGKIEEYLHRNGIMSMSADKKVFAPAIKQKRRGQRRNNRPVKLKDNEHLRDILKDFSDKKS